MEGQEVQNFAELQSANYPTAVRTSIVAVRAPLKEGEISLNAKEKQVFDLFFIREGQLMSRYLYWEPIKFRRDGLVDRDSRGWLGQVGLYAYTCLDCREREGQGVPTSTHKQIPSFAINKAKETNTPLSCELCGSTRVVRSTKDDGGLLPQLHPTPNGGLEDQMKGMLCGSPDKDVLPKLMGIFHPDEAPAVWEPQTEYEWEAHNKAAEKGRTLLPYRLFHGKAVPQLKGIVLLCKPFSCGPVADADLYRNGRSKKDPLNVRHFQQILLGEAEHSSAWNQF